MSISDTLTMLSRQVEALLCPPFEWCHITAGAVTLLDASERGGTAGGIYRVAEFALARYLLTNGQYQKFIEHPNGFCNPQWWPPRGRLNDCGVRIALQLP